MSSPAFETRPLTEPVDPAAVRAYAETAKKAPTRTNALGYVIVVVIFFMGLGIAGIIGNTIGRVFSAGDGPATIVMTGLALAIMIGAVVAVVIAGGRSTRIRRYRLDTFARANAMTYEPLITDPPLPGMIFSEGSSRQAKDAVSGAEPRFVQFANYEYTTGSGKNRTTHKWGYVAVRLNSPLPHIVLDAVGNNGIFGSNLPAAFNKSQRLGLEGDFDKFFTLSCPEGYESDALYLFTPDIMARFIDNAAELDVEIVDDWLFFYSKRQFVTLDPATWAWLFSVVGAMTDKLDQWERWRDERLATAPASSALPFAAPVEALTPPAGVAPEGRRLRRRAPWVAIAFGVIALAVWFLPDVIRTFTDVFGR